MLRVARTPLPWLAALLVAYLLVPIGAFLLRLGRSPHDATGTPDLAGAVGLSIETASVATAFIAVAGVPLAYLLSRGRSRTSEVLGVALQMPLAFPPLVSGVLLLYVVGPYTTMGEVFDGRLTDTRTGIVLAQIFVSAPFAVIASRSAFAALEQGWDDVAATLGHGRWSRFVRVALPAAGPGIAAGLLLSWLRAFGEFGATVLLAYHPTSLPVLTYVQFGSAGVTATSGPVAVTLLAAAGVLLVASIAPRIHPRRRSGALPAPHPPSGRPGPQLDLDLDAALGGFRLRITHRAQSRHLAVLGPSGAGKTLTLRLIAGLAAPGSSRIRLDGQDVTRGLPEHREVGYLPQESVLLPHLPVARQVVFGVGADPGLAAYWLQRLQLSGLERRGPGALSGGQRRRVALVRALARNPRILLLDEPSTGLDSAIRDDLRRELRALQRDTALTTVLVTHDPAEAALLADEVIVIEHGRVLQAGSQPEVFARPANATVARLLGVRNLATGRVVARDRIAAGAAEIAVAGLAAPVGAEVTWCIRPEHVEVTDVGTGLPGRVLDVVDFGAYRELLVDIGDVTVQAHTGRRPAVGADCGLVLPPDLVTAWAERPAPDPRLVRP